MRAGRLHPGGDPPSHQVQQGQEDQSDAEDGGLVGDVGKPLRQAAATQVPDDKEVEGIVEIGEHLIFDRQPDPYSGGCEKYIIEACQQGADATAAGEPEPQGAEGAEQNQVHPEAQA